MKIHNGTHITIQQISDDQVYVILCTDDTCLIYVIEWENSRLIYSD